MRKRTKAREAALKILYQREITQWEIQATFDAFWKNEGEPQAEILNFANRLVFGVSKDIDVIDAKVSEYATNWQLKRMAVIDRNILRLGVLELLYTSDIPPKVSINEAVELAKKFGDLESSKFVNGILDKIHKTEIAPKEEANPS